MLSRALNQAARKMHKVLQLLNVVDKTFCCHKNSMHLYNEYLAANARCDSNSAPAMRLVVKQVADEMLTSIGVAIGHVGMRWQLWWLGLWWWLSSNRRSA